MTEHPDLGRAPNRVPGPAAFIGAAYLILASLCTSATALVNAHAARMRVFVAMQGLP